MGLGGYLLWTAVIRELWERFPERKIILDRRRTWRQVLLGAGEPKPEENEVFLNNPRLTKSNQVGWRDKAIRIDLNDSRNTYFARVDQDRVEVKPGGHAIDILGGNYSLLAPEKKCELFFSRREIDRAAALVDGLGDFAVIEPHVKDEWSHNKKWAFAHWQAVVEALRPGLRLVQVGQAGRPVLEGVVDLTGRTTFREAAAVMARSRLFLGAEGGLVHAANAVGTRAVVVHSGWLPLALMAYQENINLQAAVDCSPCGLRKPCPIGLRCMELITPEQVVEAARALLAEAR